MSTASASELILFIVHKIMTVTKSEEETVETFA